MNLLAARVVLRERSLADVLDLTLPFCVENRRTLGALFVLALGPVLALTAYLYFSEAWFWNSLWLITLEAAFMIDGVFTIAVGELLFNKDGTVPTGALCKRFARRLPAYLASFFGRQIAVACSALLVFPPFMIAPSTLFMKEALLLEGASPAKAWARSRALARDKMGFCFGLWLATLALPVFGAVGGDLIGNAVVGFVLQLGTPTGDLFTDGGSGFALLGALLAVPVAATARFLGYTDLRTRLEGWDIQLRFVSLAQQGGVFRRESA